LRVGSHNREVADAEPKQPGRAPCQRPETCQTPKNCDSSRDLDMFMTIRIAVAALFMVSLGATSALAARQDLSQLTCGQGRSLVATSGALVASTGPNTYDRIVHNRGFCSPGQDLVQQFLKSLDEPRCAVGYTCRDRASNSNN
jgi:hypothetical protein